MPGGAWGLQLLDPFGRVDGGRREEQYLRRAEVALQHMHNLRERVRGANDRCGAVQRSVSHALWGGARAVQGHGRKLRCLAAATSMCLGAKGTRHSRTRAS